MDALQEKRLLRLATFLRERVPRKAFNFATIIRLGAKKPKQALAAGGGCGTVGCAIGWMPAAFPTYFTWSFLEPVGDREWRDPEGDVVLKEDKSIKDFRAAEQFFGLSEDEAMYLFSPNGEYYHQGRYLLFSHSVGERASPQKVAAHIEKFVKDKRSGAWEKKVRKVIDERNAKKSEWETPIVY